MNLWSVCIPATHYANSNCLTVVPGSTGLRIISNRRRTLARVPPFRQPPLILYRVACLPNAKSSHHLSHRSYSRSYPCTNVESLPVNRLLQITRSTPFRCVASRPGLPSVRVSPDLSSFIRASGGIFRSDPSFSTLFAQKGINILSLFLDCDYSR